MSFITPDVIRAHMETALEDDALQVLIDAEEKALARRIGTLESTARTETFTPTTDMPITLTRPTDAATAEVDDEEFEIELGTDLRTVTPASGYWGGTVEVTYSPNDGAEVWAVLIELMRLRLTETAYISESTDGYSYDNDATARARKREGLIRSLLPRQHGAPKSVRLTSSVR